MAAPFMDQWSPATKIAVHEAFVDFLDGPSGNASVTIHRNDDILLATFVLERPCGIVDPVTGQITFVSEQLEEDAPETGTAAYASIRDSSGNVHRSLGCIQGMIPVINKCVLNNLLIESGSRAELTSMVMA